MIEPFSRRQHLKLMAAAGLAVAGLAGCSSKTPATTGGSSGKAGGKVVISVRGHFLPQMKTLTEQYTKLHPETTFELQTLPDDAAAIVQRLSTAKLGGNTPEIIENIDVLADQLASNNVTENLVPYFDRKAGLTAEDFIPAFLDQYRPVANPGEIRGMPVSADATVLYFNQDLFEKNKLALPTDSWTWDDMDKAAQALTTAGAGKYYGMVQGDPWQAIYNPLIHNMGGFTYDKASKKSGIGSAEAVKAWSLILGLFLDKANAPYSIGSAATGAPTFDSGKVGMTISVRALLPTLKSAMKQKWGVVQMPTVDGKRPVGGGSYGLSMTTASKAKDAAWNFLVWFYQVDGGQPELQKTYQSVPPTKEGLEKGIWRTLPAPPKNPELFATAATSALMAPQLPQRAQSALDDAVKEATQKVVLKNIAVADAFKAAEDKVNAALAQAG